MPPMVIKQSSIILAGTVKTLDKSGYRARFVAKKLQAEGAGTKHPFGKNSMSVYLR